MKIALAMHVIALGLIGISLRPGLATEPAIEQMPTELETRFALSAVPSALRAQATVYLLDPRKGYEMSRPGTSGLTCLVERTVWELADFRDDIVSSTLLRRRGHQYLPKGHHGCGRTSQSGNRPLALKAEIEGRYKSKTIRRRKVSLSYMVAPVMRTVGPPDMKVHTMPMPHLMFYAPHIANDDIGAAPDLSAHASLLYPFVDKQGIAEQSYMIQLDRRDRNRQDHCR